MLARKSTIADLLKGCYCSFILLYGSAAAAIEPYEVIYIGTLGGYAVPHSIKQARAQGNGLPRSLLAVFP